MIKDKKLEYSSQWALFQGPDVGDALPHSFTITPANPGNEFLKLTIDGPSYAGALAGLRRPYLPNSSGLISTDLELMTDDAALTNCQAHEVTMRICDDQGYNYNGSFQFNYQKGGMVQVYGVPPNPAWVDTGIIIPKFTPWQIYHVRVNHFVDTVKHTFATYSFEVDGKVYTLPTAVPPISGEKLGWVPGLYNQLQLDLVAKGGKYSTFYRNVCNLWL